MLSWLFINPGMPRSSCTDQIRITVYTSVCWVSAKMWYMTILCMAPLMFCNIFL